MRNIESGISTLVSVVLISISACDAFASAKKGTFDKARTGGQAQTQRSIAGTSANRSQGTALQEQMQNENRRLKQPAHLESPNLRGTEPNSHSSKLEKGASSVVEHDLDQPDMAASKNEVSIETREKSATRTGRTSWFLPEVDDQVLLRERGQPHKQPPTLRGPHKQTPSGRGPHRI